MFIADGLNQNHTGGGSLDNQQIYRATLSH